MALDSSGSSWNINSVVRHRVLVNPSVDFGLKPGLNLKQGRDLIPEKPLSLFQKGFKLGFSKGVHIARLWWKELNLHFLSL